VRAPSTFALALGFCAACSSGAAQSPLSGAEAVRQIDWNSVSLYSLIPELMPTGNSDDPVEAGFAPQWIEHALNPSLFATVRFALKIVSTPRTPSDQWSYNMRNELRTLVRTKVQNAKNVRVFCNAIGCLCYAERDEPNYVTDPIVYRELLGTTGRELHLKRDDLVDALWHVHGPGIPWELTIIRHSTDDSHGSSETPAPVSAVTPNNRWRGP
jgi:hypothetical protein